MSAVVEWEPGRPWSDVVAGQRRGLKDQQDTEHAHQALQRSALARMMETASAKKAVFRPNMKATVGSNTWPKTRV